MQKINQTKSLAFILILTTLFSTTVVFSVFVAPSRGDSAVTGDSFSIMQISDTQFLASQYPQLFKDTTSWIVSNSANYNLKMVIHTGDIVDNINGTSGTSSDPQQWSNADNAMNLLLNASIPYCWDAGNHDQIPWNNASGTWLGSSYTSFNATNMRSKAYWISDYYDSKNTAVRFTYKGYDFLIVNIEYMATNDTLDWMKNLLNNFNGSNAIVAAHTYLNKAGGYGVSSPGLPGEVAWCNNLRTILDGYPKVFLTLSGHDPTGTANMTKIGNREEIFFDRQGVNSQTGAAAIRIYTFNLTSSTVSTSTYAYNITSNTWNWLTDAYNQFNFNVVLNSNDWTLVNSATLKAYPNVSEYTYQKNATMAPNGQYDKIGLHRLVKTGITPKAVVFINPGTYMSAEQLISNPPTDSYTLNENSSEAIYWANQGFDVYAIDYRTHFVPNTLNISQLSFMQNWGWDQWISDIREAVLKTKDISGATKIFMAGMSFGGGATMNYASIYGNQDLRGIILLDGGNATKNPTPTNTYNLTAALNQMNSTGTWALETPNLPGLPTTAPSGWVFLMKYASQNPSAPAQYPPGTTLPPPVNPVTQNAWANITEWCGFVLNGASTNIAGGFGNSSIDTLVMARMDRYWPLRLNLESSAINDWTNNSAVTYDFDDNYGKINVPLFGFTSELFGLSRFGPIGNSIASSDVTKTLLPSYGHLDVFFGTYSAKDVSKPTLDWMTNHTPAPLAVYVTLPPPSITTGQTTTLIASPAGGVSPYTVQWYENGNALTGQTTNQIAITKNAAGTFTYFCQITDSEGKTANSAVTTLTINPQTTQTPTPTTKPTATPTQEPTPTPTPTTTPTTTPTAQPSKTPEPATFGSSELAYAAIAGLIIAIIVIAAAVVILRKRKK